MRGIACDAPRATTRMLCPLYVRALGSVPPRTVRSAVRVEREDLAIVIVIDCFRLNLAFVLSYALVLLSPEGVHSGRAEHHNGAVVRHDLGVQTTLAALREKAAHKVALSMRDHTRLQVFIRDPLVILGESTL